MPVAGTSGGTVGLKKTFSTQECFMLSIQEHGDARNTALVVSGEPPVRSTVKSILSGIGFYVSECESVLGASSLVQRKPCPDLLVTEARPPEVDGWTLAESFMGECPLGRVVLMSDRVDVGGLNQHGRPWVLVPTTRLSELLVLAVHSMGLGRPQHRILVVEDETPVRNLVQLLLTRAGYVVISAGDGQEALELSRLYPGKIDLVITDIEMPRMSGSDLAEHIKLERPDTQVLLMSGYASGVLREFATTAHFLRKAVRTESTNCQGRRVVE